MIRVTRLDGSELTINCELLETVEATPDTVVSLVNNHKLVVRESVDDIVGRVLDYKTKTHACPLLLERAAALLLQNTPAQDSVR